MEWIPPTQAEVERGILAWYCIEWQWNVIQPCPYNAEMLARRLKRGDDMPPFVDVVQPLDTGKELDYLFADGISEAEFSKRLKAS